MLSQNQHKQLHWKNKILFPAQELKDDEIYAPSFKDGEKVVVTHFPLSDACGMIILNVNNSNKAVRAKFGQALDSVGINKNVADGLPGADFEGDMVAVLPLSVFINENTERIENN